MNKVIYIDFDGVLVDTPNMINNALKNSVNSFETCKNLAWNYFLKNCSEIENNFSCIEEISKKYKVVILTHVYSENELLEKEKFISNLFQNVDFVPVPYNIEKNKIVNSKGNILIDDYSKNVNKWIESGGIGIHLNTEKRIDKLLNEYLIV